MHMALGLLSEKLKARLLAVRHTVRKNRAMSARAGCPGFCHKFRRGGGGGGAFPDPLVDFKAISQHAPGVHMPRTYTRMRTCPHEAADAAMHTDYTRGSSTG